MTLRLLQAALILLPPWLLGRALQRLLRAVGPGLAYPLGAVVLATVLALAAALDVLSSPATLGVVIIATLATLVFFPPARPRRPRVPVERWPAHVLCATLALTAWTTPITGYDAIAFWSPRGKALAATGSLRAALTWGNLQHPDYPFLAPLLEAWASVVTLGGADEGAIKLYLVALVLSLVVALRGLLAERIGPPWLAELFVCFLAAMPLLRELTIASWPDLALACFNGLAAVCAVRALFEPRALVPFALLGGAAVATKYEGTVLFACLALPLLVDVRFRRGPGAALRAAATCAAGWLLGATPWLLSRWWFGLTSVYATELPSFSKTGDTVAGQVARVLLYLARDMTGDRRGELPSGQFGLVFPYLVVMVVAAIRARRGGVGMLLAGAVALQIAAYAGIFIMSPHLASAQIPVASYRLLLHVAPVALISAALLTPSRTDGASDATRALAP